ncbi:MAG: hypothetical protein R3B72_18980 [Polyangiaceae bacterium]
MSPAMLLWTLRSWPKAQPLARALQIPPEAWEIPFLFVAVGGPELSIFEARERPELGGLTARLKALTKPLAAAATSDPWVRDAIARGGRLAVAFQPGVDEDEVRRFSEGDGYRVWGIRAALEARGPFTPRLVDEGLADACPWSTPAAIRQALASAEMWQARHHSAAFRLVEDVAGWGAFLAEATPEAADGLGGLVLDDLAHPVLALPLQRAAEEAGVARLADRAAAWVAAARRRR